jgi:hypothetical protein
MAELLFITPQEVTSTTILGANVDVDKYLFTILNTQLTVIEPLIGTELYNKIVQDKTNNVLSGKYLELFEKFIKPITKYKSVAEYIEVASFNLNNSGLIKFTQDGSTVVDKDEVLFLSNKYNATAQMFIQRFEKWICNNNLPEYKTYQDEVNARKGIKLTGGWKL